MHTERLGDGYSEVGPFENQHEQFLSNNKICKFGLKYKNQPNHCMGQHSIHTGSYVVDFSLIDRRWERFEFGPLTDEENVSEVIFNFEDGVYILLYTNFGSHQFKDLFKWSGYSFDRVPLTCPSTIRVDPDTRISIVAAKGLTNESEIVLLANGNGLRIFKLSIDDDSAKVDLFHHIEEGTMMLEAAVAGFVQGNNLAISYGVYGCGFRWNSKSFIKVDLTTTETTNVDVDQTGPSFGFSGSYATSIFQSDNGVSWLHAAGRVPRGMTGGDFDGSVWVIHDVFTNPRWEKLEGTLPDADLLAVGNDIYSISQNDVIMHRFN